jgi:hypothetical protein
VLPDRLDLELHDSEQLQEIHMLANLILACSTRPTRLTVTLPSIPLSVGRTPPTRTLPDTTHYADGPNNARHRRRPTERPPPSRGARPEAGQQVL